MHAPIKSNCVERQANVLTRCPHESRSPSADAAARQGTGMQHPSTTMGLALAVAGSGSRPREEEEQSSSHNRRRTLPPDLMSHLTGESASRRARRSKSQTADPTQKSQDDERRATAATATAGEEYRARGRRDVMMNVVVIV